MGTRLFAMGMLAVLMAGCASNNKLFEVTIRNDTHGAIAAGLVKNGEIERGWDAPRDVAYGAPELLNKRWGALVPPGKAVTIQQTGTYDSHSVAFLRVYSGDETVETLLSRGPNSPQRVDVTVYPGRSAFVITDEARGIQAEPVPPPPLPPPAHGK